MNDRLLEQHNAVSSKCMVTMELVIEVAESNRDLFFRGNDIDIYSVLYHLGFKIDGSLVSKGVVKKLGVYVRNPYKPDLVYKTDVFEGKVRKAVDKVVNGTVFYKKQYHPLVSLYRSNGLLHATDFSKFDVEFINILDFGNPNCA